MAACPKCQGVTYVLDDDGEAVPCECREATIRRGRQSRLSAVVPPRFSGIAVDPAGKNVCNHGRPLAFESGADRQIIAYINRLEDNVDAGRGLWLEGGTGTGKTTLAICVTAAAIKVGYSTAIYSAPELLARIRGTFGEQNRNAYLEMFDQLTAVDLLHVDDLGAEQQTEWVLEQLYAIVNRRYENNRATIVTTNLTDAELVDQVGARIVSRLAEACEFVLVAGPDLRRVAQSATRVAQ